MREAGLLKYIYYSHSNTINKKPASLIIYRSMLGNVHYEKTTTTTKPFKKKFFKCVIVIINHCLAVVTTNKFIIFIESTPISKLHKHSKLQTSKKIYNTQTNQS